MEITKTQLKRLENIKGKAAHYQELLDKLVAEAEAITKESEGGLTFDFILNGYPETTEKLLDHLEITVK